MASDLKRTIEETIMLYSLEPTIKSIYVEGAIDKAILELFIGVYSIECNVYEINSAIDFSNLITEDISLGSNRNKLIKFSTILNKKPSNRNVVCIIDKDFDNFLSSVDENDFLLRSDYSCIEAYIFNNHTINKILKIGFSNFPVEGERVIQELSKILPSLYFLRYLRETEPELKFATLIKVDNAFSATRDGVISFNLKDYIERFCDKNAIRDRANSLLQNITDLLNDFDGDIREVIHGHDFSAAFFRYVNIVKNTNQFKEANFEKALFIALEMKALMEHELFINIYDRFNLKSDLASE